MVFGCDYDDTLVDFSLCAIDFHNRMHGTNFWVEDMKKYSFEKLFGLSKERGREFIDEFLDSDDFKNLRPSLEVIEAVRRIAEFGRGYVVTSRHDRFMELTKKRVVEDFRLENGRYAFVGVYFARNSHTGQCQDRMTKDEACKCFSADFMIEDDPIYARMCAVKGIRTFLINRPWNKTNSLPSEIIRVGSMTEVAGILEGEKS